MNGYEYALDSTFLDDYDSDESDQTDETDETDEHYERRKGRRRAPRIATGKVAKGGGVVRPPAPAGKFVTRAEFAASITKVDKKIDMNGEALKKVTAQTNKITADLGAATARLDKQVGEIKKDLKKQSETSLLLTLLSKPPPLKVATAPLQGTDKDGKAFSLEVVTRVEQEKQNMMLPILLLSTQGGLGGGDSSNMMILALAMSGQF